MSAIHNNIRRHRQVVKKRTDFGLFDIENKRSPPPDRIGNPPPESDPPQGITPPLDPSPPDTTDPNGPTNGPNGPSGGHDQRPTHQDPGKATPTKPVPPTTTPTINSAPSIPPTSTSGGLFQTTTSSSTIPSSTTTIISTSKTVPTTQNVATGIIPTSYSGPSIATGPATDAISPTVSATGTSTPQDGLSTGSVVGIVAAGIVAVAAVVVVGMWLTKRYFKKREEDEFNRNSFIRQSVHIPDEAEDYRSPRPPTMIERHYGAVSPQPGYGNNMYAPPVPPMPSMYPGDMMMANHTPSGMANPFTGGMDYGMQHQQQPALVRVPSNGSSNSFHGGVIPGTVMSPPPATFPAQGGAYNQYPYSNQTQKQSQDGHGQDLLVPGHGNYADLQRSSVTPDQAAQYAEISRQLNIPSVVNSPVTPGFSPVYGRQEQASMEGRLPTPAPVRGTTPGAPTESQRGKPPTIPVGGYSFPVPLSGTSTPPQDPASVAHAAAMAALRNNGPSGRLQPGNANGSARPASAYDEEDAYGGM